MSAEEIRKLVERIKNASLPSDRRAALKQLAAIAASNPSSRTLIREIGIKAFYAVLQQDHEYEANMEAILKLFFSLFSPADDGDEQSKEIAAYNIDAFLGLPDALSLILDLLAHSDYPIRALTLELVTAMAAYSRRTLQAALLETAAGVSRVCDCIDDDNPALKGNAVILLAMIAMESEEVGKIVAFSGVPDKLFDLIQSSNPKAAGIAVLLAEDSEASSAAVDAAAMVQDALELFSTLIESSAAIRVSLKELGFVPRTVELLNSLISDAGLVSPSSPVDISAHKQLWEQNARNISLCCHNIKALVQGNPSDVRAVTAELASTDVFAALQALAFLPYAENYPNINNDPNLHIPEPSTNIQTAQIRKAALSTISVLVRSTVQFRILFYTSLCASKFTDAATPQINVVHTMLHDRSAALRTASYVSLRESFVLDPNNRSPCTALLNAFTGSTNLTALVQTAAASNSTSDVAGIGVDEDEVTIPSKYLAILGEALKDALTLYPKGSDEAAVFYAAALLAWTLNRVQGARERLLAAFAHNAGNSLFPQIMRVLSASQRMQAPSVMRIGLLSLVASWLYQSSAAVSAFLQSASHLPMIVEILQKGAMDDEKLDVHVKGLAAVILGVCLDVTEGDNGGAAAESGFLTGGKGPSMMVPRGTISDLIRNHIGISEFTARLEDLKATPQFAQPLTEEEAWKLAARVEGVEKHGVFFGGSSIGHEQYYDKDVVDLIGNVYEQIAAKAMYLLPNNNTSNGNPQNSTVEKGTPYDAANTHANSNNINIDQQLWKCSSRIRQKMNNSTRTRNSSRHKKEIFIGWKANFDRLKAK